MGCTFLGLGCKWFSEWSQPEGVGSNEWYNMFSVYLKLKHANGRNEFARFTGKNNSWQQKKWLSKWLNVLCLIYPLSVVELVDFSQKLHNLRFCNQTKRLKCCFDPKTFCGTWMRFKNDQVLTRFFLKEISREIKSY